MNFMQTHHFLLNFLPQTLYFHDFRRKQGENLNSQVHNLQKLKNISLKAVNFFATKTKVTCLSERVFFHLHIPELPQFSRPYG